TPCNHFALLAEAWLQGRLDLGGAPPAYAQNNDFASFGGKWFVAFPPLPAVLLLPFVKLAGAAESVRDGQVFLWLSGVAPAVLFLALEKLRRMGASVHRDTTHAALALLLSFGTVYFFTALQGTVWFAAHVVGTALGAIYLLAALGAESPVIAGLALGLGFLTRTPLAFAFPLFLLEALRVSIRPGDEPWFRRLAWGRAIGRIALFAAPVVLCVGLALLLNHLRFGRALDFGYAHLTVAWAARMKRWGLFHYHYLARNLSVVLAGLPFVDLGGKHPLQINQHGLALWITTPVYVSLLWPKRAAHPVPALYATAAAVAIPGLFYQNTGWMQFGYRFSNDYAVFLFALLATTRPRFGAAFRVAALVGIAVNTFGALTFDRAAGKRYYLDDPSQKVYFQPD
ncbi:MAG: hypothetical protein FJ104_14865, partial [Deltaproteobacteria bacterium]|nr:hypothetical protein [Deltaproteobacteria bacterium]